MICLTAIDTAAGTATLRGDVGGLSGLGFDAPLGVVSASGADERAALAELLMTVVVCLRTPDACKRSMDEVIAEAEIAAARLAGIVR